MPVDIPVVMPQIVHPALPEPQLNPISLYLFEVYMQSIELSRRYIESIVLLSASSLENLQSREATHESNHATASAASTFPILVEVAIQAKKNEDDEEDIQPHKRVRR